MVQSIDSCVFNPQNKVIFFASYEQNFGHGFDNKHFVTCLTEHIFV